MFQVSCCRVFEPKRGGWNGAEFDRLFSPVQNITITTQSLSRRRAKKIRSLSRKKYREKYGQFIVEGRRAVEAALDAEAPVKELVVAEGALADSRVQALGEKMDGTVYLCPDEEFREVSQVQHAQGVLGVVESRFRGANDLRSCTSIVALDGVQDPGNAGTLLRTAAWFGVDGVVAGPGTVDLTNPKVVRAAMGAHWELELATAEDLSPLLERFRAAGITPYAADLRGTPIAHWKPEKPSLLVLGSEAHGISAPVRHRVNERVYITRPVADSSRPGGVESLNVGVAAGIILHHWLQ